MFIKDWQLIYVSDRYRMCRMALPKVDGESFVSKTVYHPSGRIKLRVGESYTVQENRSKVGMFRIKIKKIVQLPYSVINTHDAQAMGYRNLDHWRERWQQHYPDALKRSSNPELFLVDFDLE
jgi:hypothetical protein